MTFLSYQSRKSSRLTERVAISCGVLAGHIAFGALLCWVPHKPVMAVGDEGQVAVVSLVTAVPSPARQQVRPAKPKALPKPVEAQHEPEPEAEPVAAEADAQPQSDTMTPELTEADALAVEAFNPAAAMGEPNTLCNLTATLAGVFAQSPEVQQGLAELPASKRSVANAIMLWDGDWSPDSLNGGHGLLRALLVKAVSSARPDCLQQANTGPVLFLVPDHQTTVVLAIGSGEWRWGDLIPAAPIIAANNYF